MAISAQTQDRFLQQDGEFWDAVFDVCRLLVYFPPSAFGAPQVVVENAPGTVGAPRMRLIYPPESVPHNLRGVVNLFSNSPSLCYPCGRSVFVCSPYPLLSIPIGYADRKDMQEYLKRTLVQGDFEYSERWVEQTDRLYDLWLGYLRRHYDRSLKAVSVQARLALAEDDCRKRYGNAFLRLQKCLLLDDTLVCEGQSVTRRFIEQALGRQSGLESAVQYLRLLQQQLQIQAIPERPRKAMLQPCFVCRKGGCTYTVYFDAGKKEFVCRQGEPQISLPFVVDVDRASGELTPPFEALYRITGGDWAELENLAKLVAYCLSAKKLYGGAVILPQEHSFLMFYVLSSWFPEEKLREYTGVAGDALSFFAKSRAKDFLIAHKMSGIPFLLCEDDTAQIKPDGWQRLKKLMNGAAVTYNDAILRKKKHKNTAQWLIVGNDATAAKLKRSGIPYLYPKLNGISGELMETLRSGWMSLVLPIWGMMLIKRQRPSKIAESVPQTLRDFVRERCEICSRDGGFLPARTLYDAYVEFCEGCGHKPMLFKDFNRALEEDFGLKRTRKHVTSGSNVTGYRRIAFIGERASVDFEAMKYEAFCRKVEDIRREVFGAVEGLPVSRR